MIFQGKNFKFRPKVPEWNEISRISTQLSCWKKVLALVEMARKNRKNPE